MKFRLKWHHIDATNMEEIEASSHEDACQKILMAELGQDGSVGAIIVDCQPVDETMDCVVSIRLQLIDACMDLAAANPDCSYQVDCINAMAKAINEAIEATGNFIT